MKNHFKDFIEKKPDLRPFEQAWREDFPKSKPVPKLTKKTEKRWNKLSR